MSELARRWRSSYFLGARAYFVSAAFRTFPGGPRIAGSTGSPLCFEEIDGRVAALRGLSGVSRFEVRLASVSAISAFL